MRIGFLSHQDRRDPFPLPASGQCMLRFDSGRGVTFADAGHHVCVFGTTGSGKTASVVLPGLYWLMRAGHCGLLVDIKGNLREQARALARDCGREADLVEYGSAPSATPLNILRGMDRFAMYDFFKTLTLQSIQGRSNNVDWLLKGVSMAADCGQLLCYLHTLDPMFSPNVATIAEMLDMPAEAAKLCRLFMARLYDPQNEEQAVFVERVKNNRFHVFNEYKKGETSADGFTNIEEQRTWSLDGIRQALRNFLDAPGIAEHFAAPQAPGLDMRLPLRENRIVLLRFGLDTGPIGASLARILLSGLYAALFELGLSLPAGRKCFVCIDEYQEVADLSEGRYSDVSFIAQAREFNGIFLASTQSVSALMHRGNSVAGVEAFVSNCNTRVTFYSDDPLTQAMVSRYDPGLALNTLQPGQAFVVRYEQAQRRHVWDLETFADAFASTRVILDQATPEPPVQRAAGGEERPSLRSLAQWAVAESRQQTVAARRVENRPRALAAPREVDEVDAPAIPDHIMQELLAQAKPDKENEQPCRKPRTRRFSVEDAQDCSIIQEKFPHFFAEDAEVSISIPSGWVGFVERAFKAFEATHLRVALTSLSLDGARLRASETETMTRRHSESGGLKLLNSLLQRSAGLCALCGGRIAPSAGAKAAAGHRHGDMEDRFCAFSDDTVPICDKCLKKYELDSPAGRQRPGK